MRARSRLSPPPAQRQVALLIETSNAYARALLQGVVGFSRNHGPWSLQLVEQGRGDDPPRWLARWKGDGIIARIESRRIAGAVLATGRPAVDVSAGRLAPALPWVETDDTAIARLAAEHLMERGFRRFAYCGDARFAWSHRRAAAFRDLTAHAGFPCKEFTLPKSAEGFPRRTAELSRWLRKLTKPIGLFAGYDILGQQILDACREAGVTVPEEAAVIGVDDDELLCELANPPLSSVIPNARGAGYKAASLLCEMMSGKSITVLNHLITPLGVRQRQSTNILTTEDPHIARALRFIREHACDPINVSDVVSAVGLSRRILERRFLTELSRTPHAEILNVRMSRVRSLLADTKLSLEEIAERTGFEHPEYLTVVFKRETGVNPSEFRRQLRR